MFEDKAGFGRINKAKYCWCGKGIRPNVPCHHIREYRYLYGPVEPKTGENFFLLMPNCNTDKMNVFIQRQSEGYKEDIILLVCDGASWHKSKGLKLPENIVITHISAYIPEMNPIEQIWKQIRQMGFKNEIFNTLNHVMERLCETINKITKDMVKSIRLRDWIGKI